MDTLEEKLLEKMAVHHTWYEILKSTATTATALSSWVECYCDCSSYNELVDNNIQRNIAILELHIQLLHKVYYINNQEIKKQIIQEIAKKYDIVDNN